MGHARHLGIVVTLAAALFAGAAAPASAEGLIGEVAGNSEQLEALKAQNAALQKRIDALENKVAALSARIETRLDALTSRLGGLEQASSSAGHALTERVGAIENRFNADRIVVDGVCFRPRKLTRCFIHGDHMTWVDNAAECRRARYGVEGEIWALIHGC